MKERKRDEDEEGRKEGRDGGWAAVGLLKLSLKVVVGSPICSVSRFFSLASTIAPPTTSTSTSLTNLSIGGHQTSALFRIIASHRHVNCHSQPCSKP
jgi:hypothetical protein